ncbi:MAG: ABC transporter ATP-binding protein [Planctomycetota bacterium]
MSEAVTDARPVLVEAIGLGKSYPKRHATDPDSALEGFDLVVRAGEAVVLAGGNGAGKSTALRILAGIEEPSRGRALVGGLPPRALAARRMTGWLPDTAELFPFLDWRETLDFFVKLADGERAALTARAAELAETFGLTAFGRKRVRTYSLGMRRRLAIAATLVAAPRVLLLDEPIGGLDPDGQHLFSEVMRREKDRGAALVVSSHHLGRSEEFADRLVVLRRGRIGLAGAMGELAERLGSRDITAHGLDGAALAALADRARELGGTLDAPRLAASEIESFILDADPETPA